MKTKSVSLALFTGCGLLLVGAGAIATTARLVGAEAAVSSPSATTRVVAAANAFLATLDDAARSKAVFPADDETQRKRWSNFPSGIFERKGLRLGDLSQEQRAAAEALLAAALSPIGLKKTLAIMEGDEVLRTAERPGRLRFGRDEYYISFVGQPSTTNRWIMQFGGHHLGLNITVIGAQNILTPSHTAAQPASYLVNGKTVRPLGEENDRSFELINALNETQKKEAIIGARFRDLVLGPGQEGRSIVPEGIKVSTFDARQKAILLDLIACWVGIVNEEASAAKMAQVKAGLAETYFAWSGPTTPGTAAYFRIHGPTVFIEYAPQQMGGDGTQHIHTILRDPTNDYGMGSAKNK